LANRISSAKIFLILLASSFQSFLLTSAVISVYATLLKNQDFSLQGIFAFLIITMMAWIFSFFSGLILIVLPIVIMAIPIANDMINKNQKMPWTWMLKGMTVSTMFFLTFFVPFGFFSKEKFDFFSFFNQLLVFAFAGCMTGYYSWKKI
jgi:hypothetical protein